MAIQGEARRANNKTVPPRVPPNIIAEAGVELFASPRGSVDEIVGKAFDRVDNLFHKRRVHGEVHYKVRGETGVRRLPRGGEGGGETKARKKGVIASPGIEWGVIARAIPYDRKV